MQSVRSGGYATNGGGYVEAMGGSFALSSIGAISGINDASVAASTLIYASSDATLTTTSSGNTKIGAVSGLDGTRVRISAVTSDIDALAAQVAAAALTGLTGASCTGLGTGAFAALTSGTQSTAIGVGALASQTSNGDNTAVGYGAGGALTGGNNTIVGSQAAATAVGVNNITAVGYRAARVATADATAVGSQALLAATSGGKNTAVGYHAGDEIVAGAGNSFVGYAAGVGLGNVSNKAGFGMGNGNGVYFDVDEVGNLLNITVRYAAGTFKTATVALT
jgi:hypothetical protein